MPYIKQEDRKRLSNINFRKDIETPGELNYLVTELVNIYVKKHGLNYQHINDVVGALEGAKMEFYRRVAIPYENNKILENGDVGYEEFDPNHVRDPKFHR